jgi:hypothetical protein
MRHSVYAVNCLLYFALASPFLGAEIAFEFHGMVLPPVARPFGVTISDFGPVTGKFLFDDASAPTHNLGNCTCTGYAQNRFGGFSASFDGVLVRADEYTVAVYDNILGAAPDTIDDVFAVRFDSSLVPPLGEPLVVDGEMYEVGIFELALTADANLFSDASLPTDLDFGDFSPAAGTLDDLTLGGTIYFLIDSMVPIQIKSGDYNLDWIVDQSDYDRWRQTYGSTSDRSADGNHDGVIDAADYTVWRNNLDIGGSGAYLDAPMAPEPSTHLLLLFNATITLLPLRRPKSFRR